MTEKPQNTILLSALVVVHNEEERITDCLEKLGFADEIVVVLDKCTDKTKELAGKYTKNFVEGGWEIEGPRRNAGIEACKGVWILEVDADEHVPPKLASEIRDVVENSAHSRHLIMVNNYVGNRLVKHGWGASFGKAAYPGLFRKGTKVWGNRRLHPPLELSGSEGPPLKHPITHYVDRNTKDMVHRLNSYSSARALDLIDHDEVGGFWNNLRRFYSRFFKCYVSRKGYKEGHMGLLIALCAGLYPMMSYLKARVELENKEQQPQEESSAS